MVGPRVVLVTLAVLQLALVLHTKSVMTAATEDAVRTAAAFGGDTAAGELRLRALLQRDLRGDLITGISWYGTLDTLTLRVRSTLPLVGTFGPTSLVTTASAYHEEW